jgi:hypothetical protein
MKLRTGKSKYKVPCVGRIDHAFLEGNQKHNQMHSIALCQMDPASLPRSAGRGIPVYFSYLNETIEFYPVPDKPYVVTVRYTPPMQEF